MILEWTDLESIMMLMKQVSLKGMNSNSLVSIAIIK